MAALSSDTQSATPEATPPAASDRLMSLDALRGFDMFWIAGGSYVVGALNQLSGNGIFGWLKTQLTHVEWAGFHFYDLIFPLFVFINGVSLTFSLTKTVERHGPASAFRRIVQRGLLLFLLGILYSGGFSNEWPGIRVLGVLQRIALSYVGAGTLFLLFKTRGLVASLVAILLGYWALFEFVPIRDFKLDTPAIEILQKERGTTNTLQLFEATTAVTRGHYDKGLNVVNHFDYQHLPGKLYDTYFDPEGILSTLPAVGTALLGVLAGIFLRSSGRTPGTKAGLLMAAGVVSVILGSLWGFEMPVIKKLWTSSFVLVAGGYSLLLLGTFFYVVDVAKKRSWCQPFVWVGMNSITIYFSVQLLNFRKLAERLVGGSIKASLGTFGEVLVGVVTITLLFLFARMLYKKKIFLRL
jgi:predicted acyltransferase